MGAYANPQEIEGQFDATQNQRNYQHMFDTITASAERNSTRLGEVYAARAKQNETLIKTVLQKKSEQQIQINKELTNNKTGLDFSFLQKATDENARLNLIGTRSLEENTMLAQTSAVAETVHSQLSTIAAIEDKASKAFTFDKGSPGAIDLDATDPDFLQVLQGLKAKDKNKVGLDFANVDNKTDFTTTVAKLNGTDKAYSLSEIENAFTGGGDYGITYVPNPITNITKIQNQVKAQEDGNGIFIMKDNEFSGKVTDNYLDFDRVDDNPKIVSKTANGGQNRIDRVAVKKGDIAPLIKTQAEAVVKGSMEKSNDIASLYNNFTLTAIANQKKTGGKSVKGDRTLEDYEKYKELGTVENPGGVAKMKYSDANIFDQNVRDGLAHNQVASVLNSLPDYQETGVAYHVGPKALKLEDKKEITAKSDPEAFKILTTKISDPKNFAEGQTQVVTFDIGKESSYKVKLTKTKSGFKFRVIGNNTGENNQQ